MRGHISVRSHGEIQGQSPGSRTCCWPSQCGVTKGMVTRGRAQVAVHVAGRPNVRPERPDAVLFHPVEVHVGVHLVLVPASTTWRKLLYSGFETCFKVLGPKHVSNPDFAPF